MALGSYIYLVPLQLKSVLWWHSVVRYAEFPFKANESLSGDV